MLKNDTESLSIGIDLTGSENKPSGIAVLANKEVITTARLKFNDEFHFLIAQYAPDVISIDSPLSLPENPNKIYRDCELELKHRGMGVYWCLLPSMKSLTYRGIALAENLRAGGWNVIESYPGAAQDILGIPRKSKGIDILRQGLVEYGIKGNLNISHDELDAITAALVGILYLQSEYEALGCLIIPKPKHLKEKAWKNLYSGGRFYGEKLEKEEHD
jgi:predicted nuclease with RNAse H fold